MCGFITPFSLLLSMFEFYYKKLKKSVLTFVDTLLRSSNQGPSSPIPFYRGIYN